MATRPLSPSRLRRARPGAAGWASCRVLPESRRPPSLTGQSPVPPSCTSAECGSRLWPCAEHTATTGTRKDLASGGSVARLPGSPTSWTGWSGAGGRMPDPEGLRVKRGVQGCTELARGERLASDGEGRSLPEWPAGRSQGSSSRDGARTSMPHESGCPLPGTCHGSAVQVEERLSRWSGAVTKPLEAAPSRSPPTLRPAGPVLPSPARPARGRVQCPEAVTFPVVTLTPAQSKAPAAPPAPWSLWSGN